MKNYILITGASSGIGYEMAVQLANGKHHLILTARNESKLKEMQVALIARYGIDVQVFVKDLSQPAQAFELYHEIIGQGLVVSHLVNNAGFGEYGAFLETSLERELQMINLNVSSLVILTKLFAKDMAGRKSGRIMNVASLLAFIPFPYYSIYSSTKSFVLAFSETLASELEGSGVVVSVLCPGTVETPFHSPAMRKTNAMHANKPMPAKEVAEAGVKLLMHGKGKKLVGLNNWFISNLPRITPSFIMKKIKKQLASPRVAVILLLMSLLLFGQQALMAQTLSKKYDPLKDRINWPVDFHPSKARFYIHNEIEIQAPPEVVWAILIDASNWPEWYVGAKNVVVQGGGKLQPNAVFEWETMDLQFSSEIKEFVPNERLSWLSEKKQIQGYHAWYIEPRPGGCLLVTDESQKGWLTFFEKIFQPNKLIKLHDVWLKEIKRKAEGRSKGEITQTERDQLILTLRTSMNKLEDALAGLKEYKFYKKSEPNSWSISECLEHLALAERKFPDIVKEQMSKAPAPELRSKIRIKDEEIRPRMTSRNWKARSPEVFRPSGQFKDAQAALEAIRNQRKSTIEYATSSRDALRYHYWRHPLTGQIDLYQTLLLMSAHMERHTEQIMRIRAGL